jgi:hypothetical protein
MVMMTPLVVEVEVIPCLLTEDCLPALELRTLERDSIVSVVIVVVKFHPSKMEFFVAEQKQEVVKIAAVDSQA